MTVEPIETSLLRFVNEDLLAGAASPVTTDDEIVLDGTVDSLAVARLIGFMETEFALAVPAEDVTIENFRTMKTLAEYVHDRLDPRLRP